MDRWAQRTWQEVNLDSILHNLNVVKGTLKDGCKLLYIIKADAYGCGAVRVSQTVEEYVDMFGVATIDEALELRSAGIGKDILILGPVPLPRAEEAADNNITFSIFSLDYCNELLLKLKGKRISAHIMIDSGMSRLGFYSHDFVSCDKTVSEVTNMIEKTKDTVNYTGIYSHFAVSDSLKDDDVQFTEKQFLMFKYVADRVIEESGIKLIRHCCASAAVMNCPEKHLDMVRPGLILYGALPTGLKDLPDIRPVVSVKSTISQIRRIKAGDSVSYGRNYRVNDDRLIATIPYGYADGFPRCLTNKFRVLVNGEYACSAGNVCMDQLVIDVTGIEGVTEGQAVTFIGKEKGKEIKVEEVSALMGSIPNEYLTNVGSRLPKIYIKEE